MMTMIMTTTAQEAERRLPGAHPAFLHAHRSSAVPDGERRRLPACIGRYEASLLLDAPDALARGCSRFPDGEIRTLEARPRGGGRRVAGDGSAAWASCAHQL